MLWGSVVVGNKSQSLVSRWGRDLWGTGRWDADLWGSDLWGPDLWVPPHSYDTDLVVCVALGCDMFDCVFPTRTAVMEGVQICGADRGGRRSMGRTRGGPFLPPNPFSPQRFGSALGPWGSLQLKNRQFAKDFRPIDEECDCPTCQRCAGGTELWALIYGAGLYGA